jgi:hypothetical protein
MQSKKHFLQQKPMITERYKITYQSSIPFLCKLLLKNKWKDENKNSQFLMKYFKTQNILFNPNNNIKYKLSFVEAELILATCSTFPILH